MATTTINLNLVNFQYSISYNDIDEAFELIEDNCVITSVTKSSTINTVEVSINGGAFAVPSLPLSLTALDEVVWKIVFVSGTLGSLSIKGNNV